MNRHAHYWLNSYIYIIYFWRLRHSNSLLTEFRKQISREKLIKENTEEFLLLLLRHPPLSLTVRKIR